LHKKFGFGTVLGGGMPPDVGESTVAEMVALVMRRMWGGLEEWQRRRGDGQERRRQRIMYCWN
jgi:hypothetical protein